MHRKEYKSIGNQAAQKTCFAYIRRTWAHKSCCRKWKLCNCSDVSSPVDHSVAKSSSIKDPEFPQIQSCSDIREPWAGTCSLARKHQYGQIVSTNTWNLGFASSTVSSPLLNCLRQTNQNILSIFTQTVFWSSFYRFPACNDSKPPFEAISLGFLRWL